MKARSKGCGKSAPRPWQQGRHGKPHREQDRIGASRPERGRLDPAGNARVGCWRCLATGTREEWSPIGETRGQNPAYTAFGMTGCQCGRTGSQLHAEAAEVWSKIAEQSCEDLQTRREARTAGRWPAGQRTRPTSRALPDPAFRLPSSIPSGEAGFTPAPARPPAKPSSPLEQASPLEQEKSKSCAARPRRRTPAFAGASGFAGIRPRPAVRACAESADQGLALPAAASSLVRRNTLR